MKTKTAEDPEVDIASLLAASQGSPDPDAAFEHSQRAADLLPDDPNVQAHLQSLVFQRLRGDATIAFLAETERHYIVTFRKSRPVVVPKGRASAAAFPARTASEGERIFGWLRWVAIGLVPAGIGALVLSPIVIGAAIGVLGRRRASPRDRRLALVTILLAGLLGLLGMVFSLALALHVVG